jgi:AcrR family transcriptional regulator
VSEAYRPVGLVAGVETRPTSLYSQGVNRTSPAVPGPPPAQSAGSSVVDRLLATAGELFYREGIHSVGIQRVIDEAGVAKASLYAHFKSKDDLVAAYLAQRSDAMRASLSAELASIAEPSDRLLHLFDRGVAWTASPEFRGCPFQNAQSELACEAHPGRAVLARHRAWMRELVTRLVTETGVKDAGPLSGALMALLEGAGSRALAEKSCEAARDARWAAGMLLSAAGVDNRPRDRRPGHRRARGRT